MQTSMESKWIPNPNGFACVCPACPSHMSVFASASASGQYGPTYRVLARAWSGDHGGSASAVLRPRMAREGMEVHPADIDDAQGISLALEKMPMVFSVGSALLQGVTGELWVRRRFSLHNHSTITECCLCSDRFVLLSLGRGLV